MADFIYSLKGISNTEKFSRLYRHQKEVAPGLTLFSNYDIEEYQSKQACAFIVGTCTVLGKDKGSFITGALNSFDADTTMPSLQRNLVGQYVAIIVTESGKSYIQSDFLNIRSIFFDAEAHQAASAIGALDAMSGSKDDYKAFEFRAMRGCLYPQWLGSTTALPSVSRLRICQYLEIDHATGALNVHDTVVKMDNTKPATPEKNAFICTGILKSIIGHFSNYHAASTITGGYDSRIISAICSKKIDDLTLRISTFGDPGFKDLKIARKVASVLGRRMAVYNANLKDEAEDFFNYTDGLTPFENCIVTSMMYRTGDFEVGFGGTLGTEIFSTLRYVTCEELVSDFCRIASQSKDSEKYIKRFEEAIRNEIEHISSHIKLAEYEERDIVRLFWTFATARFSSPIVSAYDINGHQMEPFATFPMVEAALGISYDFQGDQKTHGRFYMIPKMIMKSVSTRVGMIDSTHFAPFLPVSFFTFPLYVIGKFKANIYYKTKKNREFPFVWDAGYRNYYE
ncbi:MAG: hypothetical protein MJY58_04000 [Bacteroidaceae bacterium]|nr:hypothetical protein [Bacteroidaceae bacterium]